MVHFTILDKSLKAAWDKRLHETDASKWCPYSPLLYLIMAVDLSLNVISTHTI